MANCYAGLQYSEEGSVRGISGYVDMDWFDSALIGNVHMLGHAGIKLMNGILSKY